MRVLLLYPPRYMREDFPEPKWSSREYKDGYFNEPHNPYLGPSILGLLRHEMPHLDLQVLDAQLDSLTFPEVERRVHEIRPDLILCMLNIAGLDKDKQCAAYPFPTIGIMQAYVDQQEAVELYDIEADYFTKTDIETTVLDAVREFEEHGVIKNTAGLIIRRKDGASPLRQAGACFYHTPDRPLSDISKLPPPAFDLFDIHRYMDLQEANSGSRFIFLYTTRGCPYQCHYCAAGTKAYQTVRKKTVEQILADIRYFMGQGFRDFYFYDDEFAIDRNRAKEFCRRVIAEKLDIRWACYNTVNLLDEELVKLSAKAGCKLMRLGLETGDMELQRDMNTYMKSGDEVVQAFKMVKDAGIWVDTFILLGIPGETHESVKKTLHLLKKAKPDRITTSFMFPKPYSMLYKELKTQGKLLEPDWSKHVAPSRLTFVHENYKSMKEIVAKERWLLDRWERFITIRDFWENRTGKNFYTKTIRFARTFPPVRKLIKWVKKQPAVYQVLAQNYQRQNKFVV